MTMRKTRASLAWRIECACRGTKATGLSWSLTTMMSCFRRMGLHRLRRDRCRDEEEERREGRGKTWLQWVRGEGRSSWRGRGWDERDAGKRWRVNDMIADIISHRNVMDISPSILILAVAPIRCQSAKPTSRRCCLCCCRLWLGLLRGRGLLLLTLLLPESLNISQAAKRI